jgi:hypothetical protein
MHVSVSKEQGCNDLICTSPSIRKKKWSHCSSNQAEADTVMHVSVTQGCSYELHLALSEAEKWTHCGSSPAAANTLFGNTC